MKISHKNKQKLHFWLSVALFFLAFSLAECYCFQLDLTDNKRNTLSPISKNILEDLKDTIVINYYYSNTIKDIANFPEDINRFLEVYERHSPYLVYRRYTQENIDISLKDLGLQPNQVTIQNYGHYEKISYYSGLELIYKNKRALIPFLESTHDLEYTLSTVIEQLIHPFKSQIGLVLGEASDTQEEGFKALTATLKDYNLKLIDLKNKPVVEQMPLIILIGSSLLTEKEVDQLKNFVIKGGSLLLCVAGTSLDVLESGNVYSLANNPLILWLSSLGVLVNPDLVIDNINATTINGKDSFIPYPCILTLTGKEIQSDNLLLKGLTRLIMPWMSSLTLKNTQNTQGQILLTSSPQSLSLKEAINAEPCYLTKYLQKNFKETSSLEGETLNLACSLKFDPTHKPWQDKVNESRLILFTSRYIFHDALLPFKGQNMDLLVRCVNWLLKREHLVSLKKEKPIISWNLSEEQKIETHERLFFINCFILPLLILCVGFWLRLKRKRSSLDT